MKNRTKNRKRRTRTDIYFLDWQPLFCHNFLTVAPLKKLDSSQQNKAHVILHKKPVTVEYQHREGKTVTPQFCSNSDLVVQPAVHSAIWLDGCCSYSQWLCRLGLLKKRNKPWLCDHTVLITLASHGYACS
jgi:hypothetical protein